MTLASPTPMPTIINWELVINLQCMNAQATHIVHYKKKETASKHLDC